MRENDARMVKIMFLVNINQNRCSRSYKTVVSSNTCKIYTFDLVKTMGNQKLDFFFSHFIYIGNRICNLELELYLSFVFINT